MLFFLMYLRTLLSPLLYQKSSVLVSTCFCLLILFPKFKCFLFTVYIPFPLQHFTDLLMTKRLQTLQSVDDAIGRTSCYFSLLKKSNKVHISVVFQIRQKCLCLKDLVCGFFQFVAWRQLSGVFRIQMEILLQCARCTPYFFTLIQLECRIWLLSLYGARLNMFLLFFAEFFLGLLLLSNFQYILYLV